jgi:hypothetical protein
MAGGPIRRHLREICVQPRRDSSRYPTASRGEPVEARSAYMQRNAALYGVDLANLQR